MITLAKIKKEVLANNGTYTKLKIKLNCNDAYEVNGKTYTKIQLIEAYKMGAL